MLSISLFADEVREQCTFYKHSVPTARLCPNSFEDYFGGKALVVSRQWPFAKRFDLLVQRLVTTDYQPLTTDHRP